jgi:hypothetical protein
MSKLTERMLGSPRNPAPAPVAPPKEKPAIKPAPGPSKPREDPDDPYRRRTLRPGEKTRPKMYGVGTSVGHVYAEAINFLKRNGLHEFLP